MLHYLKFSLLHAGIWSSSQLTQDCMKDSTVKSCVSQTESISLLVIGGNKCRPCVNQTSFNLYHFEMDIIFTHETIQKYFHTSNPLKYYYSTKSSSINHIKKAKQLFVDKRSHTPPSDYSGDTYLHINMQCRWLVLSPLTNQYDTQLQRIQPSNKICTN